MKRYRVVVELECETEEEAQQAIAERLDYDEDYGFDYQFVFSSNPSLVDDTGKTVSEVPTWEQLLYANDLLVSYIDKANLLFGFAASLKGNGHNVALLVSSYLSSMSDKQMEHLANQTRIGLPPPVQQEDVSL